MKERVNLSTWSVVLTVAIPLFPVAVMLLTKETLTICVFGGCLVVGLAMALFYAPLSISVTDNALCINRSLRIKTIPFSQIASVEPMSPTMAEKRICGSGGCFGYWGWFKESSIGKYFAYYGKASDCFLVTLKDGRKYMLGCANPGKVVAVLNERIG